MSIVRPRFSVVIPAYQASATLSETLEGLLDQDFPDWECLVVDDGSTDGTASIARQYAVRDARIRLISQANQGTAGAYNTGVSASVGEFIVICSADDVLLPQHLSTMSAFIGAEPGYDIYSSNGYYWRPGDRRELAYGYGSGLRVHSLTLIDLARACFYSVGAAYRRGVFDHVGGYRLGTFGEDYDFWLRSMAMGATHRYTPTPLSLHRIGAFQKSASLERMYRSDIELLTSLKAALPLQAKEHEAIEAGIRHRYDLIHALREPWRAPRASALVFLKAFVRRVVGRERARRVYFWLRGRISNTADIGSAPSDQTAKGPDGFRGGGPDEAAKS